MQVWAALLFYENERLRNLAGTAEYRAIISVNRATPGTLAVGGALLHEPVRSSNLRSVGYDQAERVLEVAFHSGGLYRYENVPAEVHVALMMSSSKGGYLAQFVKGRYRYRLISG
ncbi:KTSC domain-containing protein [Streptomyces sp. A0958]|uniref:KTSC domain-containing protein n=1 Tax=Streptomyces sp. A0958 TaxID=2563101 RepID=UPI0023EF5121|nr:KTSC domain-containing protein [Streptomyces sp. A0958]